MIELSTALRSQKITPLQWAVSKVPQYAEKLHLYLQTLNPFDGEMFRLFLKEYVGRKNKDTMPPGKDIT
jgi:hypothetical protein